MANLVYRKSVSPTLNANTAFKGSPLTNDELDNNLFALDAELQTKALINNAIFTGTTTIPNLISANPTFSGSITAETMTLASTFSHGGLSPTAGTNIDQIYTVTDTGLVVTTSWVSTSVNFAELPTGSYMVQLSTGNEFYTGIMSWYAADINSVMTDEIILHRASAGAETSNLFLRVERTDTDLSPTAAVSPNMTLQLSSSVTRTSASYTYKFRRMI